VNLNLSKEEKEAIIKILNDRNIIIPFSTVAKEGNKIRKVMFMENIITIAICKELRIKINQLTTRIENIELKLKNEEK